MKEREEVERVVPERCIRKAVKEKAESTKPYTVWRTTERLFLPVHLRFYVGRELEESTSGMHLPAGYLDNNLNPATTV